MAKMSKFEYVSYRITVDDIDEAVSSLKRKWHEGIEEGYEEIGDRDAFIEWAIDIDGDIDCNLVPESRGYGAHEAAYQWVKRFQQGVCGGSYTAKRNRAEYRFTL